MPRKITVSEPQPSTSRGFASSTMTPMDSDSDNEEEGSNQNIELLVTNFVKYVINYSANKVPIKRNGKLILKICSF